MGKCLRMLFAGACGVGFGWFFVEFTAGHAFGSGVNLAFVEEFVVGWGGRFGTGRRSPGWNAAPGVPWTQWTGQVPPYAWKWRVTGGCQSRVAATRSKSPDSSSSITRGAISSPCGTGSAPPGQKSFWKSMIRSARAIAR